MSFPPERLRALRLMFSETECIERREFTILHKMVLGLACGDLDHMLSASTADLNTVDNNGRTPLSLAAELGDINTLSTLLKYNPDVNISSTSGASPLHFASCARSPSCIKPLLDAGAVVDSLTDWNQTPLIFAAAYVKDAVPAQLLVDAGAEVDWRDRDGITALGWTAIANNLPVARLLLGLGADTNNVDGNGDTFTTLCVTNNQTALLRLLTGRRLLQNESTSTKSLLLAVAHHATLETVQALLDLTFEGVDADAKDNNDTTWIDLLSVRTEYDTNMGRSAEMLMQRMRTTEPDSQEPESEDEANSRELFEDALEHQESHVAASRCA